MKLTLTLLTVFILAPQAALHAADAGITWLLHYDGKSLPSEPWTALGKANAKVEAGALRLSDDSKDDMAAFEAAWTGDLEGKEIVVEARVKLVSFVGKGATYNGLVGTVVSVDRDEGRYIVQVPEGSRLSVGMKNVQLRA